MGRIRLVVTVVAVVLLASAPAGARTSSSVGPIAFTGRDGTGIYVVGADGAGAREVVHLGTNGDPAWSPDGSHVAFTSNPSGIEGEREIEIAAADGSGRRQLTHVHHAERPSWSPDGRELVFFAAEGTTGSYGVYRVAADGSKLRALASLGQAGIADGPFWSPDGRWIVFFDEASGGLSVMTADGRGRHQITSGNDGDPTWSPNGRSLAFTRTTRDGAELYRVDVDGSHLRRLAKGPEHGVLEPAWSPDGKRIAFTGSRLTRTRGACPSESTAIYVVGAAGSGLRRLTPYWQGNGLPTWSPDGKRIAFVGTGLCPPAAEQFGEHAASVYVMSADGHGRRKLGSTTDFDPKFDLAWLAKPSA